MRRAGDTLIVGNCRVEPMGTDPEVDHLAVIGCRRDFHTRALPRSIIALPLGVT